MKNLRQKSSIFSITLFIILIIGASCNIFAQKKVTSEISKFLILVETTNDGGIKLTCKEGCAWKELSFNIPGTEKSQAIDQYGMTSKEESRGSSFLFTIKKTKDGLNFEGLKGTAFKNLSFSCPKGNCHQAIDQNGMTTLK